jgi:2-polyprenyl-3-methyl-5-hydroxy-6-metoxy-1,4-benzoquinol methylase
MAHPSWNESYASGELSWDTNEPEPLLVEFVTSGRVAPTLTLEIGAGTGTNALWLAEHGFDVLGIDVAPPRPPGESADATRVSETRALLRLVEDMKAAAVEDEGTLGWGSG